MLAVLPSSERANWAHRSIAVEGVTAQASCRAGARPSQHLGEPSRQVESRLDLRWPMRLQLSEAACDVGGGEHDTGERGLVCPWHQGRLVVGASGQADQAPGANAISVKLTDALPCPFSTVSCFEEPEFDEVVEQGSACPGARIWGAVGRQSRRCVVAESQRGCRS